MLLERRLHRMQFGAVGEPSMVTMSTRGLRGQHRAGLHRLAVDMDDAGAALLVSQPTCVPVRPRCSRRKWTSSVRSSTSQMDVEKLCAALKEHAPGLRHSGCSTAGEITPEGLVSGQAIAIVFPGRSFTAVSTMVRAISSTGMADITRRVEDLRRELAIRQGVATGRQVFALCFIDGLSFAEEATTSAIHWGLDDIPLIGGSAGDDLEVRDRRADSPTAPSRTDCAIVVLVSTDLPFQVFKTENFVPTGDKLVVTASDPRPSHRAANSTPLAAAEEFAQAIGLEAKGTSLTPMSFASHPVVVRVGGEYYCRSIQKVNPDGSLTFFCAIDDGIVLTIAAAQGHGRIDPQAPCMNVEREAWAASTWSSASTACCAGSTRRTGRCSATCRSSTERQQCHRLRHLWRAIPVDAPEPDLHRHRLRPGQAAE
jgi:hypothetical protein